MTSVAFSVAHLLIANALPTDLGFQRVPDESGTSCPSCAAHLVNPLEKPVVYGHLNRFHGYARGCGLQSTSYSTCSARAHYVGVGGSGLSIVTNKNNNLPESLTGSQYAFGKPVAVPYRHSTRAKSRRRGYNQISLMGMICLWVGHFLPRPVVFPTGIQLAAW